MTQRPPLWTPEEAKADSEREGEPKEGALRGCLADLPFDLGGCALEGCLTAAVPCLLLLAGGILLLR